MLGKRTYLQVIPQQTTQNTANLPLQTSMIFEKLLIMLVGVVVLHYQHRETNVLCGVDDEVSQLPQA